MNQLAREYARHREGGKGIGPPEEKRVGPYVIKETIAEGTTGTVKLAFNPCTGTHSAVKIVDKTIAKKHREAKKEIKVLQKIVHKNIIRMEYVEEDNQNIYIFTEYAENGDLFSYMQKKWNV